MQGCSYPTQPGFCTKSSYKVVHSGTYFITGGGNKKREISLGLVVQALGITRTAALPGFLYDLVEKQCYQFFLKFIVLFGKLSCYAGAKQISCSSSGCLC